MLPGIGTWLTKRRLLTPEKEAVVDGQSRLSYAALDTRVNRLAHGLLSLGLAPGDRLGILAYNSLAFVEVLMASAKLGLLLVPLNWRLTAPELAFIAKDSGLKALMHDPDLSAQAGALAEAAGIPLRLSLGRQPAPGVHACERLLERQADLEPSVTPTPTLDTPHILMYTAGTTGRPKGAILTQGASFWNALNLGSLDLTSRDRDLLVLPMFHIGGIGLFTLPMLYVGGTVVIQRTFDPAAALKLLREEEITLFFGVPAIFQFLIQHKDFDPEAFGTVRMVMSGGAPLPVSLIQAYHRAGIVLRQGFGMSEAAPSIATLQKDLALTKAGSIGKPVFHLEVRIVDDAMNDLPPGEVGELVLRGPNLMQGYWNRPEATEEAFRGGWFHSGDMARRDVDGDLYIVDRKKDMFISGGENVYPAEVENALYELPEIREAAVIGVKDPTWGEVGKAVVALRPGASLAEDRILGHLRGRLARYKIPKRVVFVEALPRNAAGKVLKRDLREDG